MLGFLFSTKECRELEYMLKKELEEMLLDLSDVKMEGIVHRAIEDRYHTVFKMYARMATPREISRYARHKTM